MPRLAKEFSIWFDYPDDPDGARVEIKLLSDEDNIKIQSKSITTRNVRDPDSGKTVSEQVLDTLVDRQETAVAAVKNWENFFDEDDTAMDCTEINKQKWACNDGFMAFLTNKINLVKKEAKKQKHQQETDTENSPSR